MLDSTGQAGGRGDAGGTCAEALRTLQRDTFGYFLNETDAATVNGERDLTERELPHLSGWRGSRPVRVGNGAWTQRQLDVYGELLSALHRLGEQVGALTPATAGFVADVAEAAYRRLGGARSRGRAGRLHRQQRGPGEPLTRGAGRDPARHSGAGLERAGRGFHPDLRWRGARRLDPAAPHRRFLAGGRRAGSSDGRSRRPAAHRLPGSGLQIQNRRRVGGKGGLVPALHLLASPRTRARRTVGPGPNGVRASCGVCQRSRSPGGRGRRRYRRAPGELSPGLESRGPGERRVGYYPRRRRDGPRPRPRRCGEAK